MIFILVLFLILDVATNEDWYKAAAVRNKMIENLANAQERLDTLGWPNGY